VGVAFVLSPTIKNSWKDYKDRVEKGEIEDGFTIIQEEIDEH
jgi:hypothetical protein